jgi:hypothetical protein
MSNNKPGEETPKPKAANPFSTLTSTDKPSKSANTPFGRLTLTIGGSRLYRDLVRVVATDPFALPTIDLPLLPEILFHRARE